MTPIQKDVGSCLKLSWTWIHLCSLAKEMMDYDMYHLRTAAQQWWESSKEIQFKKEMVIMWKDFEKASAEAYFPQLLQEQKRQQFMDL